uniref:Putative leptin receptor-like protein n=1 Tax=Corethrella appendiculata TaxID=1370023 RepID=U5EWY2_9DIPT
MAGIKSLLVLAFAGSIGMTLIILACALPAYKLWWPFFVVIFYFLSPIPTLIAKNRNEMLEFAIFITMGIVLSSFALPIVLARASVIKAGACYLTVSANIVVYLTIIGYFMTFYNEETVW